ncbi:MAG: TauD/TfdA family dioxygenase, partial [Gammaproteobacteria bacterium]
ARVAQELEDGCGMVVLRGLPVERYSRTELELLWMGICSHLGRPVFQNPWGQLLREICDEGPGAGEHYGQLAAADGNDVFLSSRARTASPALLRFHTDRADVVALMCVNQAASGGESRVASSVAVHNEMLARRPDLAKLLYEPMWRSQLGEEEGGAKGSYALPVFGVREGKFTSHYSRTYIEAADLLPNIPNMSPMQWEALDLLHQIAEELCVEMRFEPGDMQFLNSHVTYHARSAYRDDPETGAVRSLLRVWLCSYRNRALPEDHAVLWHNVEADSLRGGIAQSAARS